MLKSGALRGMLNRVRKNSSLDGSGKGMSSLVPNLTRV